MKDNNNVYERAKALTVDEHAKTTQGGSVYERAKALATDQGVEESLGDLGTRITANAEAYNRALANKNFERAKEDFNKMLEESTLNLKPYATSEDVQMEELNNFMENRANEARMRGMQDYLDQTIGAWGTEKASNAAIDLVGVDAKITTPDALMRSFNNPYSVQTLRDIASQVSDTSFASLPAGARSQAEKIADEYIAENPHLAYKRDLYVNYFASQIYDDVFKRKIYTDDKFFADAYEAITGKSYKSYKRDVDKEAVAKLQGMKRELEAMNETLKKKRDEDRTHIGQSRTLFSSAWNDLRNAFGGNIESIEDLIDEIDNVIEGSFTSGFDKGFDFDRMATVGMSGIFTEEEMAEALSKARKGEPLTEEEENYVRIHQYAQELNQLKEVREKYAEQLYDTWFNGRVNFNSIGEGVGTTVEMMPAFAGAMKLTSGIGTFAKIGGMAALKSALEAGGTELFKYGVRTVGKLGYNYGLAKARGLVVSPIMPSTYNTYLESLNSAYSFDGEGNLTYTPVNERQEYLGAIFSTANEVSSEYLGIGIGSVVGWGARGLGRMVANTRLAGVATAAGKKVRTYLPKFTPQTKVAMRTLGVQADPVSETLSEALGDIMTSYEQSMIGMDVDMSQYGTMDYWMTLAGVTLAYGGSIAALGATKSYFDVKQAVKQRDKILGDIENRNLYNALLAVSTSDDIVLASSALADFDWKGNGIEPQDNDYKLAQTFRVADLNVKIMEGMVGENTRLESFRGTIEGVRDIVYQGKAGEYSDMIFEAEVDGKKVYVINGFEKNSNTGQRIVYDPATGEKTSVDASKVKLTREISVDDYIDEAYANAFSLEMEKERIADIREKALQMNNPTEKDVQRVASTMSIALPKVGNTVMLANGNMGEVTEVLSPAEFVVRDVAGTTYKVHFTDILSTDKLTATAQGAMARGEASTPIYSANETVASTETAEVAETTPETNDENGIAMGAEVTIDGRVGKVRARTQDGRYAVVFETESGNYEDAEIEFFTGEELASLMGIAPAPTAETPAETAQPTETTTEIKATEDGSVDIEQMSAEDAAKALIQRAGTIEEAIAQVKQVIETVTEERKKTAKAQKKASLNDIGKKSAELQALDTRLEFYGEVLGVLETMLAEQQKQTMEAAQRVAEEAGVAAETPTPNEEATTTEEKQGADAKPTVGLIRNGAEMKFTDKVIEMVDFVAKRLGLTVEFVDDLKNEAGQKINGDIKGKHVRLSTSGSRGIKFITGHEFFHRMKDLVDEKTYNDFVESIKAFIGEKEWKAAMAHQRAVYRAHNARVAKDAMKEMSIEEVAKIAVLLNVGIEGLSLDDAKAVVANAAAKLADKGDATAYNLFPQMLKYSDTLMTEECAADIAGALVTNTRVFSDFVENNKSNYALVRGFRKAIRTMREFFDSFGYTEQQRKLKTLDKMLETTLKEAVKNEREGVKKAREEAKKNGMQGGVRPRNSLIGEVGASALDMAEEATTRLDNLAVAREMETSGKDAKAIRMATGWERGADGLWRYEIMDAEVNLYDGDENAIRKKIEVAEEEEKDFMQQSKADTKELRERTNTYLAEMREKYGVAEGEETDAMTEEEIAHLQSLTGKEIAFEDYKERRRNELYNRRMALEAQLAYVSVKNSEAPAGIAATRLVHILQGNDAEVLFTAYPSLRDIEVQFVTDIRDGAFAAYATKGGYKRIELNAKKTPVDMLAPYILHEVQHAIQDIEGFAGGGNLSSLQSDENVTAKEAYDYYRKIAGEVEARNVSARINMTPEERLNTLLSETEDVAREDQIFLREGVEMAMAQPRFSLSEETTQIFDAAKAKFGTTYDMREAGYILPDGSMLDFSGRHQVRGGDTSFLNGDRTVDHREISDIAYDADGNGTGINTDLGDFLDRGAIRIDSNAGAINLNVAPTKAQKDRLKRLIERNDGYVYIDFGKGWDTEHYAEYEAARASRVLGDIDRYFDEGIKPTGNVRFSLQEVNTRFNAELATLTEENKDKVILSLGTPSEKLLAGGVVNKPMKLYGAKVIKKQKLHGFDLSEIKNLPLAVANPIAVFNNYQSDENRSVLTELTTKDGNFLVSLNVGKGEDIDFNIVATVFGKGDDNIVDWFNRGLATYIDKEKALDYLHHSALNAEALSNPRLISATNIIQNFQNPKIEARNSLITPEMDASYLDAVERGDMETAQRMVMEAAKLAMPNTKVVDEDGNPKVVYHQTNHSVYINRETGQNWDELDWRERMEWDERDDWDDYWEEREFNTFSRVNARTTQELDGFFFAPEYDEYHEYGNRTIEAFLNIENPASFGDYNIDSSKTNAGRDERIRLQNEGYDGVINEEDGSIWEYIAFNPNQIKSADPVTYDDAGNVIPLSERFNPEKEDIRYSLQSVESFATYAKNMARALNIAQPIIVADTTEQFVRLMHDAGSKNPERARAARGVYRPSDDVIFINAEKFEKREDMFECILHEWTHAYTQRNIDKLKAILATLDEERVKAAGAELLPDFYKNESPLTILNEIISNFVGGTPKPLLLAIMRGQMDIAVFVSEAMSVIKGNEYADIFEAVMPVVKENLTNQKERYNGKREEPIVIARWMVADTAQENERPQQYPYRGRQRGGDEQTQYHTGNDRGGAREDAQEVTRYLLPDPDPSEVFYDEMPLYDELGNEIDFNSLTLEEAKEVLDDKVHQMLEAEYDHAVVSIRKEAEEARQAVKEVYRAEKEKRRKGAKAARTNAARIDEIFGDTPFESLPYEVQALILIATGEAKIYWGDRGNKRGLASELGLTGSTGDRHAYRNIWGGAKKSFDEVVHSWWESIGGYESGVDTNDLRNALISALQSVQSSKDAMQEIINKYDDLVTERDNVLAEIDRNEEKELHEAKSAYEQHLAAFELAEGEERAAYHDRAAQFFGNQSLSRVEDILEDLAGEIERNKRKIERLKAEKKDAYDTLAEGINKSKEVVLRALERLRMFAGMEEVDLNDVARLINLVKTARSQRQMNNLSAQATALVQRVSIKKAKTNLMRLLSLKLSNTDIIHKMLKESDTWTKEEREAILKHLWKVSRNGLRVSKAVHKDTKEIFDALAEQVKAFKKETKNMKGADLAAKIQSKLAELEKELHPEVVYDGEGNVQDNANLPTDFNAENKHLSKLIFKSYLEMATKEAAYHEASATLREKINNGENTAEANADVVVTRENYLHALTEFNSTLEHLIVKGKDELRDWNAQKEKHEIEIRKMGIEAIGGRKASDQGIIVKAPQKVMAGINKSINSSYWTFETVCEAIDHNAPYKRGKFYTYFMNKERAANSDAITRITMHYEEMARVLRECFPKKIRGVAFKRNPYELYLAIMREAQHTPLGTLSYKEMDENGKLRDALLELNIANAMYIIAMWRQPRYQKVLEGKYQITQQNIDELMRRIASVDAGFLDFMDWVNDTFLPSTRLEYDVVYRKMNGGSMPKEINYFPARVEGHKEANFDNDGRAVLSSTPSAIKDRTSTYVAPKLRTDYFKVLESHIQDMDKWAAFAEFTSDLQTLLSSDEFRRRCNEYMPGLAGDGSGEGGLYMRLYDTARIVTDNYKSIGGNAAAFLQKEWAQSNIAFRLWTAVKQISSVSVGAVGFVEKWYFVKSLTRPRTTLKRAMELSPSFRQRWKSRSAGLEALSREIKGDDFTKIKGVADTMWESLSDFKDWAMRLGMTPNAMVDAFACAIIFNSTYEQEIRNATRGKREATEQEKLNAIFKAEIAFNTTQQSNEGAYIAPVQADPAFFMFTTYMNNSYALYRKMAGGAVELAKLANPFGEYRKKIVAEYGKKAAWLSAYDAYKDIGRGLVGVISFSFMPVTLAMAMTWINRWIFDGYDDDDDAIVMAKRDFVDSILPSLLQGFTFGNIVANEMQGYESSLTPAWDEAYRDIKNIFDDKGHWWVEIGMFMSKYWLGVDSKALYNICAGIGAMSEGEDRVAAFLNFLNAPNKYVKAFVGDRKDGETMEEYQTRIVRHYTVLENVEYEDTHNDKGDFIGDGYYTNFVPANRFDNTQKEYEAAYLKDILYHYGGKEAYASYMDTEKKYKDICELLGWKAETKPNKEKSKLSDLHRELAYEQKQVAKKAEKRKNWVGSEEDYYDLLMEEQKAKNDLINNYYEYIKQTGIGAY